MRIASLAINDRPAWGLVEAGGVALIDRWPSLRHAIADGALTPDLTAPENAIRVPIEDVNWLPVIPDPAKIICIALNYGEHRTDPGQAVVAQPTVFLRFADSQIGHDHPMVAPLESDRFDYEGELAVIIGKGGRRIAALDALDHVAGYACYNDGSVRDWQAHTTQFTPGKIWPATGAFGPWMVTPDEFGALGPQSLKTRLNGQIMQEATLSEMIFSVPRLIEYVSIFTRLSPGDVIVSGTPAGVGAKRNPPLFMKPGDRVEVEIGGIGTLVNTVVRHA
jgi:2-keto-4-pentenoate hydratase/2-oxohepta-3-ene-1,7-dioic acid hydratase in catechol pathway